LVDDYSRYILFQYTLWLFNIAIAMENGPFIDGLPIKKWGFSMAMLNNQMVFGIITIHSGNPYQPSSF
jgi:hypothetical protein